MAALAATALELACFGRPTFACGDNEQCVVGGAEGVCEPDGLCSYADGSCPSGRRYSPYAGSLSETCVPGEFDTETTSTTSNGPASSASNSAGPTDPATTSIATDTGVDPSSGCGADCPDPGGEIWSVRATDLGAARARGVALVDNGLVIAGEVSEGPEILLIVATFGTADGTMLASHPWVSPAGGPDRGFGIAAIDGTSFAVVGQETSPAGDLRALAFRMNNRGDVQWVQHYETLEDDGFLGVAVDGDLRALAVGFSGTEALVRAHDIDGNEAYARRFAAPVDAESAVLAAIGSTLGGDTVVGGTVVEAGARSDLWVRRLTADGGAVFEDQVDEPTDTPDEGLAVALTPEGGWVVGGVVNGSAWLARYALDGSRVFGRAVQDGGSIQALDVTPAGLIVAAGHRDDAGQRDTWVAKFDGGGEVIWETPDDADGADDQAFGVVRRSGIVYAVGYSTVGGAEAAWLAAYAL